MKKVVYFHSISCEDLQRHRGMKLMLTSFRTSQELPARDETDVTCHQTFVVVHNSASFQFEPNFTLQNAKFHFEPKTVVD